ncbi:MAG: InlB B-repeat-containing protein [Christensenellales bacterium]
MKRNLNRAFCLLMTVMIALTVCIPAFAVTTSDYNPEHVAKARAFLEIADDYGVKNGYKINPDYDPDDPSTYKKSGDGFYFNSNGEMTSVFVLFKDLVGELDLSGIETLTQVISYSGSLTGVDVTGCTGITNIDVGVNNITHIEGIGTCTALTEISVNENELTFLDLSGASNVVTLFCYDNNLTELDLSACASLQTLSCGQNPISELDFSACHALYQVYCAEMLLTEIDVSCLPSLLTVWCNDNNIEGEIDITHNPNLLRAKTYGNRITSMNLETSWHGAIVHADTEGGGYVSVSAYDIFADGEFTYPVVCRAEPEEGYCFAYWIDNATGEIFSTEPEFTVERGVAGNYTAVFDVDREEYLVLFVDCDGTILSRQNVLHGYDAVPPQVPEHEYYSFAGWSGDYTCVTEELVLVAQYSLDMIAGDVNYDGIVETTDAVLAMRAAMGLIELDDEQLLAADVNSDMHLNLADATRILRTVIVGN